MPDWLTRDPLNGLALTIAFFIAMIVGRYLRERRSRADGRMIEPGTKLIASFLLIIAVTLMEHWYFPAAISILCIVIVLRLKVLRDYSKKIIFPLVLASFILAVQGFTYGVNEIDLGTIRLYSEGLERGLLIFSKVFASTSILIVLIITTSGNELFESMRSLRVPGVILEISWFMCRYIKTFSDEGRTLKSAQESRCGFSGSFTNKIKNMASICGLLITRAFSRSEEVHRAMLSRGWKPGLQFSSGATESHRYESYKNRRA